MTAGLKRQLIRKTATERFVEKIKVDEITGCWIWKSNFHGGNIDYQYGQFRDENGKNATAHIWAYERFIGKVPDGKYCCHRCDNNKCVNPYHLFLGSQAHNMRDASLKGRLGIAKGKRNGMSKLNIENVIEIRFLWDRGFSLTTISKKFEVDYQTIRSVIKRKTWKHVI